MKNTKRYCYYEMNNKASHGSPEATEGAIQLGKERIRPRLSNPDYLVLRQRVRLFSEWVELVSGDTLCVLDLGGRIQPYRPLIADRLKTYVAVDPQLTGLVDVIGVGEHLAIASESVDLCFCSQVLSYVTDPAGVAAEIHRVLKPGGALLLSAPAFFPCHHDERWRFLPDGYEQLLSHFSRLEIAAEGYSIAGVCRTLNVSLGLWAKNRFLKKFVSNVLTPFFNSVGLILDRLSRKDESLTANYSVLAIK